MFKSQMIKKNIELELQALILLQAQLGLMKSSNNIVDKEDEIMTIVIRKSKDEYDALVNSKQDMPIKKPQDLEIAKKLVKSEEITENLKSELEQQDYLSRKLVKDAVLNGTKSEETNIKSTNRPVSARKTKDLDEATYNLENMRLNEKQSPKRSVSNLKLRRQDNDDDDDIQASSSNTSNESSNNQIVNNLALNYLQQTGVNSEAELARRAECN